MGNIVEDVRKHRTDTLLVDIQNTVIQYYQKSGMKQTAITERTGIKKNPLSQILCGKRSIQADELIRLVVVLGIPLQEVFGPELWAQYHQKTSGKELWNK